MKFKELVGMLKSEEMEVNQDKKKNLLKGPQGIAFKVEEVDNKLIEITNIVSLLAKNYLKALKSVEDRQYIIGYRNFRAEGENSGNKSYRGDGERIGRRRGIQCFECNGFAPIKSESPVTKRNELKCPERKLAYKA